ncbi:MOSC domain-containing protein [Pseudonocardia eucalypti]|uniref:MOSC domain-containing protein n=1 Tax=Pseudonocardia eucalypti TaxID=648755 RepID=A0ABP9QU12_9PSEU|nr:uncharacterized protein YcbX [Pseudonocardia eucalypti]
MNPVGTVTVCARYPVKSVQGERPERLRLEPHGVVGDRTWALRTEDGKRGSGKNTDRWARLNHMLEMSARYTGERALLRLPDGRELDLAAPELPGVLSDVVGRPVVLTELGEGPHYDVAPVHLVTSATLDWWSEQGPGAEVAWQRARPNLVVTTPDGAPGRLEDGWIGRRLRVGSTLLEVVAETVRCVMVTQDQLGLGSCSGLLKVLAPHQLSLGVYAEVVRPGEVGLGDEVWLESP